MVHWTRERERVREFHISNHGQLDERGRDGENRTMVHWMREGEMEKSNHGQMDERGWDGEL